MDVIKQHENQLPYELTKHTIYLKNIKKTLNGITLHK